MARKKTRRRSNSKSSPSPKAAEEKKEQQEPEAAAKDEATEEAPKEEPVEEEKAAAEPEAAKETEEEEAQEEEPEAKEEEAASADEEDEEEADEEDADDDSDDDADEDEEDFDDEDDDDEEDWDDEEDDDDAYHVAEEDLIDDDDDFYDRAYAEDYDPPADRGFVVIACLVTAVLVIVVLLLVQKSLQSPYDDKLTALQGDVASMGKKVKPLLEDATKEIKALQKRQLAELESKLGAAEKALQAKLDSVPSSDDISAQLAAAAEERKAAQAAFEAELEKKIVSLPDEQRVGELVRTGTSELRSNVDGLKAIGVKVDDAGKKVAGLERGIAQIRDDFATHTKEASEARRTVNLKVTEVESALAKKLEAAKAELASTQEALKTHQAALKKISDEHAAISKELAAVKASTSEKPVASVDLPVGTLIPYAGDKIPEGWLLCDGRSLSALGLSQSAVDGLKAALGSDSLPDLKLEVSVPGTEGAPATSKKVAGYLIKY